MEKVDMAIIGYSDDVVLFQAVGIRTFIANSSHEVNQIVARLANQDCKIIYMTEQVYVSVHETIDKYKTHSFPIILPLAVGEEHDQIGKKKIRENVEKAIGIDIF